MASNFQSWLTTAFPGLGLRTWADTNFGLLQGMVNPRAGLSVCLQCNIWSPSTDTCGTGTQQAARSWGLDRALVGRDKKRQKKNKPRVWHLNATEGFEERGLGTLLWAVGRAEDSEGTLFLVDGNKLPQSLEFPQGRHRLAGAEGWIGSLSYSIS